MGTDYSTWCTMCHLGQNEKRNIRELSLMMPTTGFDLSEEDMTQTIYENYLGILGVMKL